MSDQSELRNAARLSPIDILTAVDSMLEPLIDTWSNTLASEELQRELRKIHTNSHSVLYSVEAYFKTISESYPSIGTAYSRIEWGEGARVIDIDIDSADPSTICQYSMIACLSLAFRINHEFRQLDAKNFKPATAVQSTGPRWDGGTLVRIQSLCHELIECLDEFNSNVSNLNQIPVVPVSAPFTITRRPPWERHFSAAKSALSFGLAHRASFSSIKAVRTYICFHLGDRCEVDSTRLPYLFKGVPGLESLGKALEQEEMLRAKSDQGHLGISTLVAESLVYEVGRLLVGGMDAGQVHLLRELIIYGTF